MYPVSLAQWLKQTVSENLAGVSAEERDASGAMDNLKSWSAEDEAIIATNTEATECKRSAVELGYWKDEYISYFARRAERKAPEINRGYYARVKGLEMFIHQFLERCGTKCQIINLGCGFDTLYWRLRDSTRAVANFIELDFPAVTARKCTLIKRSQRLLRGVGGEDGEVMWRAGELHAEGYHLAGCDLRAEAGVARALQACRATPTLPTLCIAECVLVYLRPAAGDALLRHLAAAFPRQVLLLYEQCNLADKFGEVMLRNLAARGCLPEGAGAGVAAEEDALRGPPAASASRLVRCGYSGARAWDMGAVWRALPEDDRVRAERLEMLDEGELLHQLHQHYAISLATQGDIFADMDLNA